MSDTTELPKTSIAGSVKFDEVAPHCEWQSSYYEDSARTARACGNVTTTRRDAMTALTAEILLVLFDAVPPVTLKTAYRDAVERIRAR